MERPKLQREWKGLRCRTLTRLSNRLGDLPQGSTVDVKSVSRVGLTIEWTGCERCGFKWRCSRVHQRELAPIERVGPPEPARRKR